MSEEDEALIPAQANAVSPYSDEDFDGMATSAKFLPRVQLMTSNSEKCKKAEFTPNHYALVTGKDGYKDLGKTVDCLIIHWRPKALDTSGEDIVDVHDPADPEFKRIQDKADNVKDSGCMYGPEFLIWGGPDIGYATFFLGSISARQEAKDVKARMNKAATLNSKYIEGKKFSWQCPTCGPCTAFDHEIPTDIAEQVEVFLNPPKEELAEEPAKDGRDV